MTPSKILLFCSFSFITGIFAASFVKVSLWLICELFLLGAAYCLFFHRRKAIFVFGLCLVFSGLGLWRGQNINLAPAPTPPAPARYFQGLREKSVDVIERNFSPPQSDLLSGILFGWQNKISQDWKNKLNITGTRHIAAVSGMNIVLLAGMLVWLGLALDLWRYQAIILSIAFVWAYIAFISLPASAVRAGIMATLLLASQALGRQSVPARTIFLAAAVMLAFQPRLLAQDWGFQLSFLAVLGLIYLDPLIHGFLKTLLAKMAKADFGKLFEPIAMTLAAQIFCLPLLAFNSGIISLIAPLPNLLISPFIPAIMVFGFFFVLLAVLLPAFAVVFAWPCWLLLSYTTAVIEWFSKFPLAFVNARISWFFLFAAYLCLGLIVVRLRKGLVDAIMQI
ncbi:MAG: ComEC/Rec2 family competence protein [Patescibacteria group bacterium]|nr:ComEC/Rec2 family competence protein [Patescibacteria group bacterium]